MEAIVALIPQLTGVIDKAGTIGVLVIICAFLYWERSKKMAELDKVYGQRDCERLVGERYRSALVAHDVAVPDVSDILRKYEEDKK